MSDIKQYVAQIVATVSQQLSWPVSILCKCFGVGI